MIVRFSDVGEFVAELDRDPLAVVRNTVRLTQHFRSRDSGITALSVIATAKVLGGLPGHPDYDLVRFERYMGDLWGMPADEEVTERAAGLIAELGAKLEECTFNVAAGEYEPVPVR